MVYAVFSGLFSSSHMDYEADRQRPEEEAEQPALSEMVRVALNR